MSHLYINEETWTNGHVGKLIFTSKKKALANAKKWKGMITCGEKLLQVTTYEMHDDCELGTYVSEIEMLPTVGRVINIEIAE